MKQQEEIDEKEHLIWFQRGLGREVGAKQCTKFLILRSCSPILHWYVGLITMNANESLGIAIYLNNSKQYISSPTRVSII